MSILKKLFSGRDAAPAVLYGLKNANTEEANPIIVDEHGGLVNSSALSHKQQRAAYNASGQQEYVGEAQKGLAESATGWLLHKLEYNASGQYIKRTIAYDSWDNHATTASYS